MPGHDRDEAEITRVDQQAAHTVDPPAVPEPARTLTSPPQSRLPKRQPQPWDQRADEPAKAYALFLVYKNLGIGRSLAQVAKRSGARESTLAKLSVRLNWGFRADQWDAFALRHRAKAAEKRVVAEAELEARTVQDLVVATRILVKRALRRVKTDRTVIPTMRAAADLADVVIKLSRLSRGEATSRHESTTKDARARVGDKLDQIARALEGTPAGGGDREAASPDPAAPGEAAS